MDLAAQDPGVRCRAKVTTMIQYINKYPIESLPVFLNLLPIIFMIYKMAYHQKAVRYFFWCMVFKLLIDVAMLLMAVSHIENLFLYNTWVLVSYCFLSAMFYESFDIEIHKRVVQYGSISFILMYTCEFLVSGITSTLQFSPTAQCLLMILYTFLFFRELTISLKVKFLLTYPLFWIASSLLIYYASCTFSVPIYAFTDKWPQIPEMHIILMIPYIFETIFLISCTVGFALED